MLLSIVWIKMSEGKESYFWWVPRAKTFPSILGRKWDERVVYDEKT